MGLVSLSKGLDIPIDGAPRQQVVDEKRVSKVALLGQDYIGMKPTMLVDEGDHVRLGQVVFEDKKLPGVKYTAPGTGVVREINRGEKRFFLSMVIELDSGSAEQVTFPRWSHEQLASADRGAVVENLIESGTWPAIRQRPFGKVADPENIPHSIFVTAMDTNPLAPSIEAILKGREDDFKNGLRVLAALTEGRLYVCTSPEADIPLPDLASLSLERFSGPHPAGNAGTHIHFLDPVNRNKTVWNVDAKDVIAMGHLFTTGEIDTTRVISLAGPGVKTPRLVRTRLGAFIPELTEGEIQGEDQRVIAGSILSGRVANGPVAYLGRFHQQVSVISEGRQREFLGWINPGAHLFSLKRIVLSRFLPTKRFVFNTALNGGRRAIVPNDSYTRVMPLDILATPLLRAIAVQDVEDAENLGVLELVEEDLSLCTFVCPSKIDHGNVLRETLTLIEKEG
jgi:Na+-transporting NADH:ubiquinone oxidoreductase subunit A